MGLLIGGEELIRTTVPCSSEITGVVVWIFDVGVISIGGELEFGG